MRLSIHRTVLNIRRINSNSPETLAVREFASKHPGLRHLRGTTMAVMKLKDDVRIYHTMKAFKKDAKQWDTKE